MADTPGVGFLPITGYTDRLSVRPGERLAVKVSTLEPEDYRASVIRIVHADPNPAGPGLRYEPQDFDLAERYPARFQAIDRGSYARVPADPRFSGPRLLIDLLVQPWLLRDTPATLIACIGADGHGWSLNAADQGLHLDFGDASMPIRLALPITLKRRHWYRIRAGFDRIAGRLLLSCAALDGATRAHRVLDTTLTPLRSGADLTLAARLGAEISGQHFNGRLEDPALYTAWSGGDSEQPTPLDLLARWDFSREIDSQAIIDSGPFGLHGRLVNVPTRAVRGSTWSGTEMCWRHAPREYAAIHFHEDDLYDCGWETDFEIEIPPDTRSGVYGIRLHQGDHQDILPFYVLPPKNRTTARVCFLASTFTYQAYANHARGNCDEILRDRMRNWGAASPYNPDDYPIYGPSTYNFHPDGSGAAYSSRLRPMLTVRPAMLTFYDPCGSGLRHFSADSHLLDWLEHKGIEFDVVTDEDLDDEGVELIRRYPVVITGSHPEYHTSGTLDALSEYTRDGGRLTYLGANGFYWRIARSRQLPGMIELRRAEGGIRAWAAEPGEYYHALDGCYGGLWRRNGRPPQRLGGIGFTAQGLFEGSYYRRLPDSYRPEVAWIFEGVEEEKLGDYGLSGGGAAGFELDRADFELGTPEGTLILARSEGHSDSFVVVPEELLSHIRTVTGEPPEDLIRGEIVYFETPGGGAVFAVGSICFCGSLSHNDYDNGISRMLENVLRRFSE